MANSLVLPRPVKSLQNGADFRGKTLTYWACQKGKSGLSATERERERARALGKYTRAVFAQKEQSQHSKLRDREIRERVKVSESRTFGEKKEGESGSIQRKGSALQ